MKTGGSKYESARALVSFHLNFNLSNAPTFSQRCNGNFTRFQTLLCWRKIDWDSLLNYLVYELRWIVLYFCFYFSKLLTPCCNQNGKKNLKQPRNCFSNGISHDTDRKFDFRGTESEVAYNAERFLWHLWSQIVTTYCS